tara:strand:- start:205 stop:552 length:348 start_codon:yes stop_codon:yes gene_type:complete
MILFLMALLSSISKIEARDFCKENNILQGSEINCINGQLLFGSFSFYSKEGQQKYEYNNDLKIKFVKKYKKQILTYLKKKCDLNRDIKIKEITNFLPENNNYKTEVIINCVFRDE